MIEWLFACLAIYLAIFTLIFLGALFVEIQKEWKRRKGRGIKL